MAVLGLCFVRRPSPVAASGGHSSSRCAGLSLSRPLPLRSTRSRRAGSVVVAHGPSCSAACGILPDQGSNPCPLHWQSDSQPLRHQGSPVSISYWMLTWGPQHRRKVRGQPRDANLVLRLGLFLPNWKPLSHQSVCTRDVVVPPITNKLGGRTEPTAVCLRSGGV